MKNFKNMSRAIDDNIKSKELKDEEINEIDGIKNINLTDKIFFIFAQKVEPNPKILFFIPLNIAIIILLIFSILLSFIILGIKMLEQGQQVIFLWLIYVYLCQWQIMSLY